MPITKILFTKESVQKIPFSSGKQTVYQDTECKYLFLNVGKDTKSFFFKRRINGKLIYRFLPSDFSLYQMRQEAGKLSASLKDDITPLSEHGRSVQTLGEVFEYYQSIKGKKRVPANLFKNYLTPWKNMPLSGLSKPMVRALYDTLKAEKLQTANSVIRYLSAMINLAIKDEIWNGVNPAVFKLEPVDARTLTLDKDGILTFLEALQHIRTPLNEQSCDAIEIMLRTGQRESNVLHMKFNDIQLEHGIWTIVAKDFKGRRTHQVILSKTVLDILKRRRASVSGDHVFPSKTKPNAPMTNIRKTFELIKTTANCTQDLVPHDLRRTHGTMLINSGVPLEVISKVLGHSDTRVTERVYAHLNTESLQKAAAVFEESISKKD